MRGKKETLMGLPPIAAPKVKTTLVGFNGSEPDHEFPFIIGGAAILYEDGLYCSRGKTRSSPSELKSLVRMGSVFPIDPTDGYFPLEGCYMMALLKDSRWYGAVHDEKFEGLSSIIETEMHTFYIFRSREDQESFARKSCDTLLLSLMNRRVLRESDVSLATICMSLNARSVWAYAIRCFVSKNPWFQNVAEAMLKNKTSDFHLTLRFLEENYVVENES